MKLLCRFPTLGRGGGGVKEFVAGILSRVADPDVLKKVESGSGL